MKSENPEWLSAKQIADMYDVPVNTVRTHIKREKFGDNQKLITFAGFSVWVIEPEAAKAMYDKSE